jgi:Rad3-related DNA helicase
LAIQSPGGVLIFFPSYSLLDNFYSLWSDFGIIDEIEKHKPVYKEPRQSNLYNHIIRDFYDAIYDEDGKKGAVMLGVCRGKLSEGLDFSDDAARMVILIGIPFPIFYDPKILLKQEFLNKTRTISGKDWY